MAPVEPLIPPARPRWATAQDRHAGANERHAVLEIVKRQDDMSGFVVLPRAGRSTFS
jgi:hypothetical protein